MQETLLKAVTIENSFQFLNFIKLQKENFQAKFNLSSPNFRSYNNPHFTRSSENNNTSVKELNQVSHSPSNVTPRGRCFNCNEYGHHAYRCPRKSFTGTSFRSEHLKGQARRY